MLVIVSQLAPTQTHTLAKSVSNIIKPGLAAIVPKTALSALVILGRRNPWVVEAISTIALSSGLAVPKPLLPPVVTIA